MIGELQRFKADYLKAMAHPVRIRTLEILRQGEASVTEIQAQLGDDVANISQHLAVLRAAGIVAARKSGLSVFYTVRDAEVFAVLDALRQIFSHRLDSMQTILAADDLRQDDPRQDDLRQDDLRQDDLRQDDLRQDDLRQDDLREDALRQDDPREDGPREDGPREDALRQDDPREDDPRADDPLQDDPPDHKRRPRRVGEGRAARSGRP